MMEAGIDGEVRGSRRRGARSAYQRCSATNAGGYLKEAHGDAPFRWMAQLLTCAKRIEATRFVGYGGTP
jgi:hypothetical protein